MGKFASNPRLLAVLLIGMCCSCSNRDSRKSSPERITIYPNQSAVSANANPPQNTSSSNDPSPSSVKSTATNPSKMPKGAMSAPPAETRNSTVEFSKMDQTSSPSGLNEVIKQPNPTSDIEIHDYIKQVNQRFNLWMDGPVDSQSTEDYLNSLKFLLQGQSYENNKVISSIQNRLVQIKKSLDQMNADGNTDNNIEAKKISDNLSKKIKANQNKLEQDREMLLIINSSMEKCLADVPEKKKMHTHLIQLLGEASAREKIAEAFKAKKIERKLD